MRARSGLEMELAAGCTRGGPANYPLAERIERLAKEMGRALAKGEYEQVVELAEEQEKLLEALMI